MSSSTKMSSSTGKQTIGTTSRKRYKVYKTDSNGNLVFIKKQFMDPNYISMYREHTNNNSKYMVDLGLCCINSTLRKEKESIFPNRTCRLSTARTKGVEYLKELALKNIKDVLLLLDWNKKNNIRSYRLSSDMFPHIGNDKLETGYNEMGLKYSLSFAESTLKEIGRRSKLYGIRLSFHPGHFNQIASPNEAVFKNTVIDLYIHSVILDIIEDGLELEQNRGILCIHGGGIYGDKKKTIERWIDRFYELPEIVKDRICLENCEKCYSSEDCLELSEKLNIPHIFDIHHYNCYNILHKDVVQPRIELLLPRIFATWHKRKLKPYFHISEQGSGKTGHHSDYVQEIPSYILNTKYPLTIDIEAKAKENAVCLLAKKYNL